jgi:serine/threonine protein kinase
MLCRRGEDDVVKLLDFGLVKNLEHTQTRDVTKPLKILETPRYMARERILNPADVDARSDIYAVGATVPDGRCGDRRTGSPVKSPRLDAGRRRGVVGALPRKPVPRFADGGAASLTLRRTTCSPSAGRMGPPKRARRP